MHARFLTPAGDAGSLSLFQAPPNIHRILADHCTSEYPVRTFGRNREVDEWKARPGATDNHLFDCVVGAHVAASMVGVKLLNEETKGQARARKKVVLKMA